MKPHIPYTVWVHLYFCIDAAASFRHFTAALIERGLEEVRNVRHRDKKYQVEKLLVIYFSLIKAKDVVV